VKFEIYNKDIKNKFFLSTNIEFDEIGKIKVCTDSRAIESDEWFLPIVGEKFDGHKFIADVVTKCAGIIYQQDTDFTSKTKNPKSIVVEDTTKFFQECGRLAIDRFKARGGLVIGLTGSNGKTTNKEYLYSIFDKLFPSKVYATHGNFNNHLGVPFCCLSIQDNHDFAILEMGTNHFGEIELLASIGKPDAGFITNIGDAHLEFLNNREGVLKEKRAIYDYITSNSKNDFRFLINGNDPLLDTLETGVGVENCRGQLDTENQHVILKHSDSPKLIKNEKVFGKINLLNLGFVSLFLIHLFPERENEILKYAGEVKPPANNRSTWKTWKNKDVFMDAYNANPSSMLASLQSFTDYCRSKADECGKVLFILGDMKELGASADTKHQEIGSELAEFFKENPNADAIFVGEFALQYLNGIGSFSDRAKTYSSTRDVDTNLIDSAQTIFVKGSRSIQLETLFS
jgi:UDP-N-acetylmuramoyl-tripeptide--D-alanyl-D-alanine ligase